MSAGFSNDRGVSGGSSFMADESDVSGVSVLGGADREAAARLASVMPAEVLDGLVAQAYASGDPTAGVNDLLAQLTAAVLERALGAEMTHHLGYEAGDPAGQGTGNSRNGYSAKTVSTTSGPVRIQVPRDRAASFEPRIVPKHARRLDKMNDLVLSLYSRGMTTRDIEAHLEEVYGVTASRQLISSVTEVVNDEIKIWQSRPLDEVYPIVYVDGIRIRVRDNGVVTIRTAYLVLGVDVEGRKHALGCWIADTEGAKFWAKVLTDLRNRGVRDILICCCDGLTGLPDSIRTVFPDTVVQTCVVHVVRNTLKFTSYTDRKKVCTAMRAIYTAPTVEAAELAMESFRTTWETKYPGAVQVWDHAWNEIIPFLDYPATLRKIVYTTNAIESMNYQIRKVTKNRGHFPDSDAAMKMIYLAIRNMSSTRGGTSGTGTHGWLDALNTLAEMFPERLGLR